MKNIAVLLTCHNRKDKTLKCLLNLYANLNNIDKFKIQVFLVDDGSTDGTYEAIKCLYSEIIIIIGDGNLFWNRGMNRAWEEASKIGFDHYLWLNDDTFLFEDSIKIMLDSSEKMENQAIIVGTTISLNKSITYGGRNENGQIIKPNGCLQQCYHFNGNIVLIPKSIFEKVGFLDPIFHHAIGDFDYGLRAKIKGVKSFVAPKALGFCDIHDVFSKWCQIERPIRERISLLYDTSCDCNPYQHFVFEKRHYGVAKASFHWLTIHIRVIFPTLWKFKRSE